MSRRLEEVKVEFEGQPHVATILLLDTSGSMGGEKIAALNEGIDIFKKAVEKDEMAKMRVDLAVITFDDEVRVLHDFSSIENFDPPTLSADGSTSMGAAILKASEMIEERKQQYKQQGIDYYRPWLFMITDGEPTDIRPGDSQWNDVIRIVHDGEQNNKFVFFTVAVDPANTDILTQIAPKEPKRLKGIAFDKLFLWLSKSLGKGGVSGSTPGEQVPLPSTKGPDGWESV